MTAKPKDLSAADIAKMEIPALEAAVQYHNHRYFILNQPEISDESFDRLVRELERRAPDSAVIDEIGSDLKGTEMGEIHHEPPMLSLDKCYEDEELLSWLRDLHSDLLVTPKIDGIACAIRYGADGKLSLAATRGNGRVGEEITANIRFVADIPQQIAASNIEVRGEVYLCRSIFKKRFAEQFANSRNLAAGAVKQKIPGKTADYQLSFFPYDLLGTTHPTQGERFQALQELGFPSSDARSIKRDEATRVLREIVAGSGQVDYEIDGVVFKVDDIDEQRQLGSTAHHPRYAIAYKLQGESQTTRLVMVEWSVSRTGAITPVGIVEPVLLSGATITRASLHNVGLVKKKQIRVGATVLVMRRGGVIPNIEGMVDQEGGQPVEIPGRCPSCGSLTVLEGDFLYCSNRDTCRDAILGELEHFVKIVEIEGFGRKILEQLFETKLVQEAADLFALTVEQILPLERMGETLARKLVEQIRARRRLPLAVFLRALGIDELGRHVAEILANDYGDLKKIQQLTVDDLQTIHTIGPSIAQSVVEGLRQNRERIRRLLKQITIAYGKRPVAGPLRGKSVVFTGKMATLERKAAQEQIRALGGTTPSQVTKELSYLVVGDEGSALFAGGEKGNKLTAAERHNKRGAKIVIMSERDFLKMVAGFSDRQ